MEKKKSLRTKSNKARTSPPPRSAEGQNQPAASCRCGFPGRGADSCVTGALRGAPPLPPGPLRAGGGPSRGARTLRGAPPPPAADSQKRCPTFPCLPGGAEPGGRRRGWSAAQRVSGGSRRRRSPQARSRPSPRRDARDGPAALPGPRAGAAFCQVSTPPAGLPLPQSPVGVMGEEEAGVAGRLQRGVWAPPCPRGSWQPGSRLRVPPLRARAVPLRFGSPFWTPRIEGTPRSPHRHPLSGRILPRAELRRGRPKEARHLPAAPRITGAFPPGAARGGKQRGAESSAGPLRCPPLPRHLSGGYGSGPAPLHRLAPVSVLERGAARIGAKGQRRRGPRARLYPSAGAS